MGGKPPNTPESFWARVDKTDDCWNWQGVTDQRGYGRLQYQGRRVKAHRLSYEMLVGPIPTGMFVLHSCDNPPCVNPDHLRIGDDAENAKDRKERGRNAYATACKQGHPWTEESTARYFTRDGEPRRRCLICRDIYEQERRRA